MLGGGRLFEAGRLFEVGANLRLGAYSNQYGMLVLEEAKIMVYITAGDDDFQNIQNGGQGRSQEEYWPKFSFILVISRHLFCLLFTMNWETHKGRENPFLRYNS